MDRLDDFPRQTSDTEENGDDGAPDFSVEEFDTDVIASARMMRQETEPALNHPDAPCPCATAPEELFDRSDVRQTVLAILRSHVGPRRAEAALRSLISDHQRMAAEGDSEGGDTVRRAMARFLQRVPDRIAANLGRDLLAAIGGEPHRAPVSASGDLAWRDARTDLHAAAMALHEASEILLRLERSLSERAEP